MSISPGFQASRTIEIDRKIENPRSFIDYFRNIEPHEKEVDEIILEQLKKVRDNFSQIAIHECLVTLLYQSIGCRARCPGCGMKCELPAKVDHTEEYHHSTSYHLPMAFHGWPRDQDYHPNLSMCYQQWTSKVLFRDENVYATPEEFFANEASDWYHDVNEKSEHGQAHAEIYPLPEHRQAWMAVRYKLIKEFGLRDLDNYHSGIYPTSTVSVPNTVDILWEPL